MMHGSMQNSSYLNYVIVNILNCFCNVFGGHCECIVNKSGYSLLNGCCITFQCRLFEMYNVFVLVRNSGRRHSLFVCSYEVILIYTVMILKYI